jgi:hypothetical protein
VPGGLVCEDDNRCEYEAEEPVTAFRPTHDPRFIGKDFLGLGMLLGKLVSAVPHILRGRLRGSTAELPRARAQRRSPPARR